MAAADARRSPYDVGSEFRVVRNRKDIFRDLQGSSFHNRVERQELRWLRSNDFLRCTNNNAGFRPLKKEGP